MADASTTTAATPNTTANAFTIANCPECEQFTGARRTWCLGGNGDIERANDWRRGQRLPPLQTYAASQEPRPMAEPKPSRCCGGVGTELTQLIKSLGVTGCNLGCSGRAADANRWGLDGCKDRRDEIRQWIVAGIERSGWWARIKAAGLAIAQGMMIDPLDPAGWIVDEAIRRAEAKACCKTS